MPSSVTSLLLFDTDSQPLVASVLYANPSATAFLLNCPPDTDGSLCGTHNQTLTVGPWARATSAASTGAYQIGYSYPGETFTYDLTCQMTKTAANAASPLVCTETNIGGNNDGTPTKTFSSPKSDDDELGWGYFPVTVTDGLEKLTVDAGLTTSSSAGSAGRGSVAASTSTASRAGSSTLTAGAQVVTSASVSTSSASSPSRTGNATGSAASSTKTNNAGAVRFGGIYGWIAASILVVSLVAQT